MEITIRKLEQNETKEAIKVARKAFGIIGYIFIGKPKHGLVAVVNNKIVGGVFYYTKDANENKIGVVSFLFSDPNFQGHGIAGKLLDKCVDVLWAQNCDALITYVQDDTVASWAAFEKRGFVRTSFLKSAKALGMPLAIKCQTLFTETFAFCVGADFYMALPDKDAEKELKRKDSTAIQMPLFILANLILTAILIIRSNEPLLVAASITLVFAGVITAGWVGTWFSERVWQFRLTQGGFLITPLLSFFAFYPLIGNWYPLKYENTPEFKRDMAFNSILVWLFLFAIMISGRLVDNATLRVMREVTVFLLLYRCVPIVPFSSYGSERVFRWNKAVYGALAVASILLIFVF